MLGDLGRLGAPELPGRLWGREQSLYISGVEDRGRAAAESSRRDR